MVNAELLQRILCKETIGLHAPNDEQSEVGLFHKRIGIGHLSDRRGVDDDKVVSFSQRYEHLSQSVASDKFARIGRNRTGTHKIELIRCICEDDIIQCAVTNQEVGNPQSVFQPQFLMYVRFANIHIHKKCPFSGHCIECCHIGGHKCLAIA